MMHNVAGERESIAPGCKSVPLVRNLNARGGYVDIGGGVTLESPTHSRPASCYQWLDDTISVYRTPKLAVLRSKRLRLAELFIRFLLLGYIAWNLLADLHFMSMDDTHTSIMLNLEGPQEDFSDCNRMSGSCKFNYADARTFPYCVHEKKCEARDAESIFGVGASHVFVATHVREILQNKCEGQACRSSLWSDSTTEKTFVTGVENYNVKVQMAFGTSFSESYNAANTQGFLEFSPGAKNNTGQYIENYSHPRPVPPEGIEYAVKPRYSDGPSCGVAAMDSPATCRSTRRGDVLSLGLLLDAAGVDLDDFVGNTTTQVRESGVVLQLDIWITNMDPMDFYYWPIGVPKFKYIYKPYVLDVVEKSEPAWIGRSKIIESIDRRDTRLIQYQTGVFIRVVHKGTIGHFGVYHACMALAVSMALLSITQGIVNHVLVRIFACFPDTAPTAIAHALHCEDHHDEKPIGELLRQPKEINQTHAADLLNLSAEETVLRKLKVLETGAARTEKLRTRGT